MPEPRGLETKIRGLLTNHHDKDSEFVKYMEICLEQWGGVGNCYVPPELINFDAMTVGDVFPESELLWLK